MQLLIRCVLCACCDTLNHAFLHAGGSLRVPKKVGKVIQTPSQRGPNPIPCVECGCKCESTPPATAPFTLAE